MEQETDLRQLYNLDPEAAGGKLPSRSPKPKKQKRESEVSEAISLAEDPDFVEYAGLGNKDEDTCGRWVGAMTTASIMGLCFGAIFARSRVFEPSVIRGQFLFERWIMLKLFLACSGTSALLFGIFSLVSKKLFDEQRMVWSATRVYRGFYSASVGGFTLGAGMAVSGSCPGMVMAQVGAGVENSWITLLGGFTGALIYGLSEPIISNQARKFKDSVLDSKGPFVDQVFTFKYHHGAFAFATFCGLFVLALELIFPWEDDVLPPNRDGCTLFYDCKAIPPSLGGILLGLLQIPAFYIIHSFLGSSTSYQTMCSAWVNLSTSLAKQFKYMASFAKPSIASYWQVLYVGFAILGSFLMELSVDNVGKVPGVDPVSAFVGGFLAIFGSRFGAGCTSGHGLSGMALLLSHGIVAVGFMFLGGIVVSFTWREVFDENFAIVIKN